MGYKTVYDGLAGILQGLAMFESTQGFNFENAPESEYGKAFILKETSGEQETTQSPELINKFHDLQIWQILIAYDNDHKRAKAEKIKMGLKRDDILAAIDNPTNWTSFARKVKYLSWEIEEFDNYNQIIITLEVLDTITH